MSNRTSEIADFKWSKQLKALGLTDAEFWRMEAVREAAHAEHKREALDRACARNGVSFGLEWKSEKDLWTVDQARDFFHMHLVAFFEQWLHTGVVPDTALIDSRLTRRLRETGNGPGVRSWNMGPVWDGAWMLISGAELHGWASTGISSVEMSMTFGERAHEDAANPADGSVSGFFPCVLSINWWAKRGDHEKMQPVVDAFRAFLERSLAGLAEIGVEEDDFDDDIGLYGLLYDMLDRVGEVISDQEDEIERLKNLLRERDAEIERYKKKSTLRVHSPSDHA